MEGRAQALERGAWIIHVITASKNVIGFGRVVGLAANMAVHLQRWPFGRGEYRQMAQPAHNWRQQVSVLAQHVEDLAGRTRLWTGNDARIVDLSAADLERMQDLKADQDLKGART